MVFVFLSYTVHAEEIDGKTLLKKGKNELESRRYEDAIKSLSDAEKALPLLGDYALLWLSEAYQQMGNHSDALKTIRTLLNNYPDSPLKRKARTGEIRIAEEVSEGTIQQLFESFIKDYPDDAEMKYLYAKLLKNKNRREEAKPLFKEIYRGAGSFSDAAYNELSPSDIRIEDMIEHAMNHMRAGNFKGAETAFKSALEKDDGSTGSEIMKFIGLSLFRQKKYREAADVYDKVNEKYWKTFSLYRAGEKEAFNAALEELLRTDDKRAGSLLIAFAFDMRRDGKIEEALKTYQDVIERYPIEAERGLWGIGWTYFLNREYGKAADVFARLYKDYNEPQYLYWKARSLEAKGQDTHDLYRTLNKEERNFYGVLSCLKTGKCFEKSDDGKVEKSLPIATQASENVPAPKKSERVEALLELGFSKEALSELIHISKATLSVEEAIYLCTKFQELRGYGQMVRLVAKSPYKEILHHFLYPLAYRDTVDAISKKYDIDPLMVFAVMREESMFDPDAKSIAGALGLMQLMPHTAYRLNGSLRLGEHNNSKIYNIKNNIHLGIYYLSSLVKEFSSYAYALAAYNAGEENLRKWIQKGSHKSPDEFIEDIPYTETRNYVKRVITTFFQYKRLFPVEGIQINSIEKL